MQGKQRGNVSFWLVMIGLFAASTLYDVLVIRRLDDRKMEKWTWATVVFGVGYTLAVVALLDWQAAKLVLVAFCFSGTPMSIGDLVRYLERKRNGDEAIRSVWK